MSDEIQEREVARRLFAAEFDDATLSYSESDEERAPNYVVTPTGARVNRLFAVGALTEVESVNDDVLRGRIADPTGAFVTYGGQYQPDAAAFLERATPPCFVSITGKGRTYQPEDGDRIFTSVRPESLNEVDADTRDRWLVAAAAATLDRLATMAAALELDVRGDDLRTELEARGVDAALASGIALAIDHYRPTEHYLEAVRRLTVQALELVAGDRDSVETLDVDPGEAGPDELGALPDVAAAAGAVDDTGVASAPDPAGEGAAGDATATDHAADAAADARSPASTAEAAAADSQEPTRSGVTAEPAGTGGSSGGGIDTGASASTDADAPADGDTGASASTDADASAGDAVDDLGDFGTGDADGDSELYELDDEERAEIESEFDTEFSTGNEVDDPGEADIDVPDVEELEAEAAAAADPDAATADDPTRGAGGSQSPSAPNREPTPDAGEPTGSPPVDGDDGAAAGGDTEATDPGAEPAEPIDDRGTDSTDATPDRGTDSTDAADEVDLEAASVDVMSDLDDGDGAERAAVVSAVADEHGADPEAVESAIQEALMGGKCYEPAEGRLKAI